MSTSPVLSTIAQDEHAIQAQLIAQVQTFASHTVRVSYMFLGVIVLVLALAGVGGYFGLKSYEAQVARAEAIEQKYDAAQKDFTAQLAAHDAQRTADAKASAVLVAQIAARAAKPPAPVVVTALAPSATAEQVRNGLQAVLSPRFPQGIPMAVQGENIEISPVSAQVWLADEVALTRVTADLSDTQVLLSLSNKDNATLKQDLTTANSTLSDAKDTIKAYKKIAVKSRWRKFLDGALKVGLVTAGVAIGHGL